MIPSCEYCPQARKIREEVGHIPGFDTSKARSGARRERGAQSLLSVWGCDSQIVVPHQSDLVRSGNSQTSPQTSRIGVSWGQSPETYILTPYRWFCCTWKFENHQLRGSPGLNVQQWRKDRPGASWAEGPGAAASQSSQGAGLGKADGAPS